MRGRTNIASHRGGAAEWPENSFTAFAETAKLPVDYVEFDVHPSADGRLVVHHDAVLDRVTTLTGPVAETPWAVLETAIINGTVDERPPLLDEVIDIFKPTGIDLRLEIKGDQAGDPYPNIEAQIARKLDAKGMLERTLISAFSIATLARFRVVAKPKGLLWLINPMTLRHVGGIESVLRIAADYEIGEIAPRIQDMNAATKAAADTAGIRLGAYAVNDASQIWAMLELGVVAFTTDRPTLALQLRAEAEAS